MMMLPRLAGIISFFWMPTPRDGKRANLLSTNRVPTSGMWHPVHDTLLQGESSKKIENEVPIWETPERKA